MKAFLTAGVAALFLTIAVPAAAQQPQQTGADVLARPEFIAIAKDLSPAEGLELAAHINVVLRQYERAIPMYEALLKTSPNRAELWAALAMAYNRADEAREAWDAANIAITLAPHYPHFHLERGIAAFRLGQYADSVADLSHYTKAFPLVANAHFYLGLAQAAEGKPQPARASLLRAARLNPTLTPSTNYYLGLIAAERGQLAMSRELLDRARIAFKDSGLAVSGLITEQLKSVDGEAARRMRAAMHEADVRAAHQPGTPASR
jgi:tetratricopeptide (TPR) repeat protein